MKNFTRGISATNWHPARSADIFWDELGLSFFCAKCPATILYYEEEEDWGE